MRRYLLIVALLLAVLLAAVLGVAIWLLNDEPFVKDQLEKYALEFTGRELAVSGPLEIAWGRETTIEAGGITFANAPWAENPHMVEIGRLRATIEIPSLFGDLAYLPDLLLEDCAIEVLWNEAGEGNWDLIDEPETPQEPDEDDGLLPLALKDVLISNCSFLYDEPEREQPLHVVIESTTLERTLNDRVVGDMRGQINGEPLEVDGWLAPASAFAEGGELEHELDFRAGEVTLHSAGTIADIQSFSGLDFTFRFQGPDIARLLGDYALPPVGEGAFDLRAAFSTRDGMIQVDVDGDLGNLDFSAEGEVDKFAPPGKGSLNVNATGPNLQAVGRAFGTDKLLPEPFSWSAEFGFQAENLVIERARLETPLDRLSLSGSIAMRELLADSMIDLTFDSDEIGRWMFLAGKEEQALGPATLDGDILVDSSGMLSLDARARYLYSELTARGNLGPVIEPATPDLDFEFRSTDMPRLAELIGYQGFPARPFALSGHVTKSDNALQFSNLALSLDRSSATASGQLSLVNGFSGSEISMDIDIPDVAELGLLFGVDDLVHEPLHLKGAVTLEDRGLTFDIGDSSLGEVRLELDGRIPDLARPTGVDARINVQFPGVRFLRIWLPDIALPEGPFAVRGQLSNRADRTELGDVLLRLGDMEANVDGHITHDGQFDLAINASGPDVTSLDELVGLKLQDVPFSVTTRLAGTAESFALSGLNVNSGRSVVEGDINIELGETKRISGRLVSPYINLNPWTVAEVPDQPPEQDKPSRFVFDETPIARVTDIGIEIDTHLEANAIEIANARYEQVEIGVHLTADRLEVTPFSASGVAGGTVSGEIVLDSSNREQSELTLNLHMVDLRSGSGAKEGQDPATLPKATVELQLHGKGRTRRELASALDGKVRMNMGPGKLAPSGINFLLSDFATQLFTTLNPYAEELEYTELECAVAAADIVSGQVSVKPVVLHTRQLTIVSQGKVDLDTERINMQFNTKQRKGIGISASDLVNPFIKVGGTLAEPSIELDPAGTVVKGGLAVATAGLSILASSLADRYLSSKDPCGDALREIEKTDSASP